MREQLVSATMKKQNPNTVTHSNAKNQWISVLIVNISTISLGISTVWTSTVIDILQSERTPIISGPLTVNQLSWIGGLLHGTGFISIGIYSILIKHFGLKRTIWMAGIPAIMSWIVILTTNQVEYLYVKRVLAGLQLGCGYSCIPLYVAEIAEPRVRGRLGSTFVLMAYTGGLITLIAGSYMPYNVAPYLFIIFPTLFVILFAFIPSTPQYFIQKGDIERAKESLRFYRNCEKDCQEDERKIDDELEKMTIYQQVLKEKVQFDIQDFATPDAIIGFCTVICIAILYGFNGNVAVLSYGWKIFADSGSHLDPKISSIIIGVVQFMGSVCSILLIDRIGRRYLLILSTFFCSLSLVCVGTFNYLSLNGVNVNIVSWIPVLCISICVFSSCAGMIPVLTVLIPEVLPSKIRRFGSNIGFGCVLLFFCIAVFVFPIATNRFELYSCIWSFATICFLGLLSAIFLLVDTTGKDLQQIKNNSS